MNTRSKRYKNSFDKQPNANICDLGEAIDALQTFDNVKFDESVELSLALGVDPKQTSQAVRGTVNLPNGSGKKITVLAFTENPEEAISAGAEFAGLEELVKKIKDGWYDFDVALSTTSAMKRDKHARNRICKKC